MKVSAILVMSLLLWASVITDAYAVEPDKAADGRFTLQIGLGCSRLGARGRSYNGFALDLGIAGTIRVSDRWLVGPAINFSVVGPDEEPEKSVTSILPGLRVEYESDLPWLVAFGKLGGGVAFVDGLPRPPDPSDPACIAISGQNCAEIAGVMMLGVGTMLFPADWFYIAPELGYILTRGEADTNSLYLIGSVGFAF